MTFIQYATAWSKSEVTQGQIMVGIGVLVLVALVGILRSENELLRGSVIPLTLIVIAGIGYGGYVIYSRPAHVKTSIAAYKNSKEEAVKLEIQKHITDNNAGKSLLKYVYPTGLILAALALLFVPGGYYLCECGWRYLRLAF